MTRYPVAFMNPRRWLNVVGIGVLLVVVAMIVSLLTLVDKEHFGFLVGPSFLMVITDAHDPDSQLATGNAVRDALDRAGMTVSAP